MKELQDEIQRELEARRRVFPNQVAKGRLMQREADRRMALLVDVGRDLERAAASEFRPGDLPWSDKLAELERELEQRRRSYPDWIAKGRLEQAVGDARIRLLERIHDLYWRELLAWNPPAGAVICWNPESPDYASDGARLYRQAVRDHMAIVEAGGVQVDLFAQA